MSSIDLEFTPLNFVKTCLLLRISDGYEEKDKKGLIYHLGGILQKS